MTCKFNADTSDGLKIVSDTSGEIDLQIDASTKVHMASDGKVGIGTTSPAHMLHVKASDSRVRTEESSGSTTFDMTNTSSGHFLDSSGTNDFTLNKIGAAKIKFKTANTERHRIDSDGDLNWFDDDGSTVSLKFDASQSKWIFGATTAENTSQDNMQITATGGGNIYMYQNTTSLQGVIDFRNPNGYIGSVRTTGSSTQFNTSSDYRMKDNINYTWNATDTVKSLKPCSFTFKADTDTTLHGFIAHELQEHIPQAVSGVKDATKTDGDGSTIIDPQGVDLGKIVPYLVKTIQELEARITELES